VSGRREEDLDVKQRRLGRTGLTVSEICLGTMTFGSMADERTSFAILDQAFEAGVDFLDIAETYPVPPARKWVGASEEIVGKWLARRPREGVLVATKIAGPGGGWFQTPVREGRTALDRHSIARAVDQSLRRLGTDYIDLYQTHWPDRLLPIDETLEGLARVIDAGKVRYVGCSNETAYGLTKSLWAADSRGLPRYETIQNNFSLLNRRFEDELAEVCRHEKLSLLPYSPIAGGVLSGKYEGGQWPKGARFSMYKDDSKRGAAMTRRFVNDGTLESTRRFAEIAREAGMAPVTLAVAWSLAHDFVGSTIIGATTAEQLPDALKGAEVTLSADVLNACNAVSREIRYPMG
jgi:aryl-alcohol dehydrogenase-like predicted oxidoreductase